MSAGENRYVVAVDQSTQGTKGLLFSENGVLLCRADRAHRQIVNEQGWVSHDPEEIYKNVLGVCKDVTERTGIDAEAIAAFGISNQRETSVAWDRRTGKPVCPAIVWQCARASEIAARHKSEADAIREKTGLTLSPYFPASKFQWIIENIPEAKTLAEKDLLALGTVDAWLVFRLTNGERFQTDYSNASRTQLFHIFDLKWDEELLRSFEIPESVLPKVTMSDGDFGETDLDGLLPKKIPIRGVLGDSHGALFGQDCRKKGQIKATYGTGSSVMMNLGETPLRSDVGLVTSLAWGRNGKVSYVFEGNLNYTGAVITWLKNDLGLITDVSETATLAESANPNDRTYFVPAFSGLGAPYWKSDATGMFTGITRMTGKKELVKACVDCIAYQITDLVELMRQESGEVVPELRVDGGPTSNPYLMQLQSDLIGTSVRIPEIAELSGMGSAYLAGIATGVYDEEEIFRRIIHTSFSPQMEKEAGQQKLAGWKEAVGRAIR